LALNVVLTLIYSAPVSYAAKGIEYKVIAYDEVPKSDTKTLKRFLNNNGVEGWEYIPKHPWDFYMIFKR
jgi:hypothetical protein